jgi:hypothetical protein
MLVRPLAKPAAYSSLWKTALSSKETWRMGACAGSG